MLKGSLLVFTSAAAYALLPILVRVIYQAEAALVPTDLAIWRFIVAVAAVWVVVLLRGEWRRIRSLNGREVLILLGLGAIFGVAGVCATLALERVPATTYTLLIYTYPAMVAVMSFVLGEKLSGVQWGAIGLALLGCALTISGPIAVSSPLDVAFPLLNAFVYALYLALAGRFNHVSGIPAGAVSMSGTLLLMLLLALAVGLDAPQTTDGWLALLTLGVVATVFAIILMFMGIARIGASNAAILSAVEPVITILLAAVLLAERIKNLQLAGGALILVSVLLLHLPRRRYRLTKAIPATP